MPLYYDQFDKGRDDSRNETERTPGFRELEDNITKLMNEKGYTREQAMRALFPGRTHQSTVDAQLNLELLNQELFQRYEDLSDPNSQIYSQFRDYVQSILRKSTPTTNSLLAQGISTGLGVQSSAKIAAEARQASEMQIQDTASAAATSAFVQNQSGATSILGGIGSNIVNSASIGHQDLQLALQNKQINNQIESNSLGNQLLRGFIGATSFGIGRLIGGGS